MNNEVILHDTPAPLDRIPDYNYKPDITPRGPDGRFKPGEVYNPIGKNGGEKQFITPILKEIMREKGKDIANALVGLATKSGTNQLPAIKEVLDRTDGKVREQIEVESRNITLVYELVQPEE
jgi:hypothetical protein